MYQHTATSMARSSGTPPASDDLGDWGSAACDVLAARQGFTDAAPGLTCRRVRMLSYADADCRFFPSDSSPVRHISCRYSPVWEG